MEALLEGPALEPPPGVVPDFDNPGGRHTIGYFVVIFGGALATISVALRLYSRAIIKKIGIEDGLLFSALGLFAGNLYIIYDFSLWPGIEVHQWNIQVKNLSQILYNIQLATIFYGLIIVLLKVAILLDWLHVFIIPGQRNAVFWIYHGLIWSNVLFYVVGTFVGIFHCTPREKIWNVLYVGGSCPIDMSAHILASGIINLISDVAIIVLPQKIIWNLHLSKKTKIGVSLLFAIGVFACTCGTVRLVYLVKMLNSKDQVYTVSPTGLWSIGEMTSGFLIMGIPSIPKVVKSTPLPGVFASLIRSLTGSSRSATQSNSPHGLYLRYRPRFQKRHHSDFDEYDLMSLRSAEDGREQVSSNGITREIHVEVASERRPDG